MTAEIAIMNRHAVVLAADSATTVTSWKDGAQERRYFKGANKLFELSRTEPVGLMIYGSAGLQGVPWELAIKAFRESLGSETHDELSGYADHFFDFVEHHDKLFTAEQKTTSLITLIGAASWRLQTIVLDLLATHGHDAEGASLADFQQAIDNAAKSVAAMELNSLLTEADVASAVATLAEEFHRSVGEHLPIFLGKDERANLIPEFTKTLVTLAVKQFCDYADRTGLVIAGYGKDDYYPVLEVFECYGFLGDRLIFSRQEATSRKMGPNAPAIIQPFATTSMIDTFRFGVAPDAFGAVYESSVTALTDFAKQVMSECGGADKIDDERLSTLVSDARQAHTDVWFQETRNQHFTPLSNVIHSLPIPDMAGLAKSLIELESLKERVTKPSESVSGPIDVAVISKYDGFVWIDRKHYFKPEFNPRFMKRLK
ncbi:hypothetical protein [Pseudomonas sp. 1928-m]|uniref:hypothetical protein n=1 Tax=Pseudomonas sp. 1928-m TaxID=3033804 RepID=UPI0023DEF4F4|nr:hypothetical protein [Pseudomonas sp. 1928-m]MDF3194268.1 hypothetical protein [Pseudomonas sp. 1928-m]